MGHGEQALYTLEIEAEAGGEAVAKITRRVGMRNVRLHRAPHPETGEYFLLEVNGRPIFCKGGNWVPPDMIYSAVDRARLSELVNLASGANFNLLRIWGGGTFAGHELLDLCDEAGILVWQDLLFACAKYPGDDPAFLAEVRAEVTWAAREFAHHPSLAVWCGNNELEWGAFGWGYDRSGKSLPDYALYHHVIPRIMREEDPRRPYWPSSPFSPDHAFPNDATIGDQHPWGVSIMNDGPDFWAYRRYVDRFPNEGGFLGASSPATLWQFLPESERDLRSFSWEHHDNALNLPSGELGVAYRAVEFWLGRRYDDFSFDDYVFASALLQAEGLQEYIANYRRRMFSSSSAIFWMYNDSWPVTHGWTIVDYYRRKKLAYHPVRRAFQPVTVVLADLGDEIGVFGVNDSPADWEGVLRFGLFGLNGGLPQDETRGVRLPANASTLLATLRRTDWEKLGIAVHGAFGLLRVDSVPVAQHRLFLARFKDLALSPAPLIEILPDAGNVVLSSPVFVWGACLDPEGQRGLPDDCFDLLPGIPYRLRWNAVWGNPAIVRTGNGLVVSCIYSGQSRKSKVKGQKSLCERNRLYGSRP